MAGARDTSVAGARDTSASADRRVRNTNLSAVAAYQAKLHETFFGEALFYQ